MSDPDKKKVQISLAQWSLHKAHFGDSFDNYEQWQQWLNTDPDNVLKGTLDPKDFPMKAKELGFEAVEYVNVFFYRKRKEYFQELKKRTDDIGIENLLLMVDQEGFLGHPDKMVREKAVEDHKRWLEVSSILGCQAIRVNAHSMGSWEEQCAFASDGLSSLCDIASSFGQDVIVENHGGLSSNPEWLIEMLKATGKENTGVLVDFDNFDYSGNQLWHGENRYDRYLGVELLMPYAKAVSSKSYDFNGEGEETSIDFSRMMQIIKKSNYEGYVSVEFEGERMSEKEGITASKELILRNS